MPPKKKLKSGQKKDLEVENKAESRENELSISNTAHQPTRLSMLPVDVLLYIYKFLTAADFVSLSQLGDPTLSELADVQR